MEFIEDLVANLHPVGQILSRLTVRGVGSSPKGVFTNSGSSNQSRSFASDLLTADGVTFIRFAALVTLRSCNKSCRQSKD